MNEQECCDVSERLRKLIATFVLRYNFWGYLFSRVRRRAAFDIPSIMGVCPEPDGTISLLYHPKLVAGTSDKYILKVIEHEGLHILNNHIPRAIRILSNETNNYKKQVKSDIWNIAADCAVNEQAQFEDYFIIDGEQWLLQKPKVHGLPSGEISEFYYLELLNKMQKRNKKGKGDGEGGNKNGGTVEIGYHGKWKDQVRGISDLDSLARKIERHIGGIVKEVAKSYNKDRGNLPSYISELIGNLLAPPKVPYYQIIRKLIKGSRFTKFQRSPTRINRKRTYTFHLSGDKKLPKISPFPGKQRDFTFDVVVMIDTSGSMSPDDIREGLSGIKNILEKDKYCYTTVLEVDAGVEKEYICKKIKDIQFNIKGRGGTTLTPGLLRAKELNCDVCLAFTDGFTEDINAIPRKNLPKKLIWVITKGGQSSTVNKTGYVVHI